MANVKRYRVQECDAATLAGPTRHISAGIYHVHESPTETSLVGAEDHYIATSAFQKMKAAQLAECLD